MKGRKKYILILVFLSIEFVGQGQLMHTVLWKIEGKNLKTPSFLLGTNHVASYDHFVTEYPVIDSILALMRVVVLENVPKQGESSVDYDVLAYGGDSTIADILTHKDFEQIKRYIVKNSQNNPSVLSNLLKMRPQLLVLAIGMLEGGAEENEASGIKGMDQGLMEIATKMQTTLIGLEDANERSIMVLHGVTDKKAIHEVMAVVRNRKHKKMALNKNEEGSESAYRRLQINYFFDQDVKAKVDYGAVNFRNQHWLQKIEHLIAANPCLIAVGLDHLKLKTGLIQQLRILGYKIEPVTMLRNDAD